MADIDTTGDYEQHLKNLDRHIESFERHVENNRERDFDREAADSSFIKGAVFEGRVPRAASIIAEEMGLTWKRTLTREDIRELIGTHDTSDIAPGRLMSFRLMDLAMEAVNREGNPCLIAAEVSCTVDTRDTARAFESARLLTRFTGLPAHAAVIGFGKDDSILGQIEAGDVFYCEMDEEDIMPR